MENVFTKVFDTNVRGYVYNSEYHPFFDHSDFDLVDGFIENVIVSWHVDYVFTESSIHQNIVIDSVQGQLVFNCYPDEDIFYEEIIVPFDWCLHRVNDVEFKVDCDCFLDLFGDSEVYPESVAIDFKRLTLVID